MGSLWGYGLLWLVSAYGIVSLVYRLVAGRSMRTVPTTRLEATPFASDETQVGLSAVIAARATSAQETSPDEPAASEDEHPDITLHAGPKEAPEPLEGYTEASPDAEITVKRSISLESLTLGLATDELMEKYGPPGHLSKVGVDGEQWRYPLGANDEQGNPLDGVLVLEFQRGRLVSKAFEQEAKAGASVEAPAAMPDELGPTSGDDPSP